MKKEEEKIWYPLESNPEQLTQLLNAFVPNSGHCFTDIYTLDDLEILFPFQFEAFLFLFPIKGSGDDRGKGLYVKSALEQRVKFVKQITDNACGTIAVLHSVLNSKLLADDAIPEVKKLAEQPDAKARGAFFNESLAFYGIHSSVVDVATEREANSNDLDTNLHFVCFIAGSDDHLYELDGRESAPTDHGKVQSGFLQSVAAVVKSKIAAWANETIEFTLLGLTSAENVE